VKNEAAVYRAYAEDGRLLYVGVSEQLPNRLQAHRSKPWWSEVVRVTAKFYRNRMDAYRAETEAVEAERPLYNIRTRGSHTRHCRICGGWIKESALALDPGATTHAKCKSRS
jgi:predicted GIY-YIG superfamily endonuclease